MSDERRTGFRISSARADLDLNVIHRWLSTDAYWAIGRDLATVQRAFANARAWGVLQGDDLVGVARCITDGATFAWICDVYIDPDFRGRGLGTWLVDTIVRTLNDESVPRYLLATRDAHDVYATLGFSPLVAPDRFMEIDNRPQRPQPGQPA